VLAVFLLVLAAALGEASFFQILRLAFGPLLVAVAVDARLLLFGFSRVLFWLISSSLLATVRGGTSFLCQTATKKRSKENALQPLILKRPERAVPNDLVLQKNAWRKTLDT
jgi:hypothetical protein